MGKNAESHKVVKNVSENSKSSGNCCNNCHVQSKKSKSNGLCSLVSLLITCPKRSLKSQKNGKLHKISLKHFMFVTQQVEDDFCFQYFLK